MAKKKAATDESPNAESPSLQAVESDFETSLKAVEQVVHRLESGELTLDESMTAYERGVGKLRQCYTHLEKVERRIELLVGFDRDGQPVTRPFGEGDQAASTNSPDDLEAKRANRGLRRGVSRQFTDDDDAIGEGERDDGTMDLF